MLVRRDTAQVVVQDRDVRVEGADAGDRGLHPGDVQTGEYQ